MRASICMATYNGEKFILPQITSILSQLSEEDEIIISDDGSTDNTVSIIQGINDSRIKLIYNKGNHGFISNFENALNKATGKYIFLSDQDDIWEHGKLEMCIQQLQKYKLVVHDALLIDQNNKYLGKNYFETLHQHSNFLYNLYKTRFLGCCMAFKAEILQECLPFPKKIVGHDYWIGMYTLFKYPQETYFFNKPLIKYRRHGNNVSSSSEKSNNSFFFKLITKRYNILICIFNRYITRKK